MTYVPTQHSGGQRPSPRARELAQRIEQTLQDFMRNYPDTKPGDIQQALRMAWGSSDPSLRATRAIAPSLVAGIFVAVGLVFFFAAEGGGGVSDWTEITAVVGVAAAAIGLVAFVKRSRG
jgi:hypothetical protein